MVSTNTRRKMIYYCLLDLRKYYLCTGSKFMKKNIVVTVKCNVYRKFCAELPTKWIALVNQPIFKHNSSIQYVIYL